MTDESAQAYHAARAARDMVQNADFLDRPAASYLILGNVLDRMRSLEVSLAPLGEWHRSGGSRRAFP